MPTYWSASADSGTSNTTGGAFLNYGTTMAGNTNITWDNNTHDWRIVPTRWEAVAIPAPRVETPREAQARQRATERAVAQHEQRVARERQAKAEADEKANQLLRDLLGDQRWQRYEIDHYVDVDSKRHPGHTYRITDDRQMISVLDEQGTRIDRLCIHTRAQVPQGDQVISKMLMAEHNEERFLKVAIAHGP